MSTENPYLYTDEGVTWQQGYDEALTTPNVVPAAPFVIAPELVGIWEEGANAGNADGLAEGWRVRLEFDGSGFQPSHPHYAMAGAHAGEWVLDTVVDGVTHSASHAIRGGAGSLLLIGMLVLIDLESFDPTNAQVTTLAGKALSDACARAGHGEVYMAACGEPGHGSGGDPMLDAGYWHGSVYSDHASASVETADHVSVYGHTAGVIRYQPGSGNLWEWIEPA